MAREITNVIRFTNEAEARAFVAKKWEEGDTCVMRKAIRPMVIAGRFLPSYPCWEVTVK